MNSARGLLAANRITRIAKVYVILCVYLVGTSNIYIYPLFHSYLHTCICLYSRVNPGVQRGFEKAWISSFSSLPSPATRTVFILCVLREETNTSFRLPRDSYRFVP